MPTLTEEQKFDPVKPQSLERMLIRNRVSARIEKMRQTHQTAIPFFRNRSLTNYIEDSVKRFNEYKERPSYKQAWQSNLANSTPRDKLIAILSKLALQSMEAQVISTDELSLISYKKERVLGLLLKNAAIKNDDDFNLIMEMLEAGTKGTVVGFESWEYGERKVRDVIAHNADGSIKVKERVIKDWNDVKGKQWPLEDVYFGNLYVNHIQKMNDTALRQVISWDDFQKEFKDYPDADLVLPAGQLKGQDQDDTIFRVSMDVQEQEVELMRYFNKETDEYLILANDIWINPLGGEGIQPLIWNHKKLPVWSAMFEPLDAHFIYGKSMPDKLISSADTYDKFLDAILDRLVLALASPLVAPENTSSLTESFLQPHNVITYPSGATPPSTLDIKEPSVVSLNILGLLQQRMEAQSVSQQVSGGGEIRNKTATQVNVETQAALDLVSLFLKMMEFGIRDKNRLRLANIMQFYTLPVNVDTEARFKKIIMRNERLTSGDIGTLEINIVPKVNQKRVEQNVELMQSETNKVEKIEITPSFIRGFEADITIVPSSSVKMNKALRQAVELNFQTVMSNLYPDKFNRDAGYQDALKVFDKDLEKYITPPQPTNSMAGMPSGLPQPSAAMMKGQQMPNLKSLMQ
jgi:hypothetical protein